MGPGDVYVSELSGGVFRRIWMFSYMPLVISSLGSWEALRGKAQEKGMCNDSESGAIINGTWSFEDNPDVFR